MFLSFIAHQLWGPDERAMTPNHGMLDRVKEFFIFGRFFACHLPHARSTVERKILTGKSLPKWRDMDHPFSSQELSRSLREVIWASMKPRLRALKRVVDTRMIEDLLAHLDAH